MNVLTDVFPSAHFLQDVDLLHRRLSELLNLLRGGLVRGGDVDDLHRVLLRRPFVDAATHHAAHSPEEEKTFVINSFVRLLISSGVNVCTAGLKENMFACFGQEFRQLTENYFFHVHPIF